MNKITMKKSNLITLAGLLSLLAVNQVFSWEFKIKNETALDLSYRIGTTFWMDTFSFPSFYLDNIMAGKTAVAEYRDGVILDSVDVHSYIHTYNKPELLASFTPRKDSSGKIILPLKGLTIKTVNGKVVIVENQ